MNAVTVKQMLLLILRHSSRALQGAVFVSVCLMLPLQSKYLKNTVCFDKNLGSLCFALNLLEGGTKKKKKKQCFYRNVFTRVSKKNADMLGGGEAFS